ncbi:membrane protein, partial [Streptomyces sp. NRRL S-444]
MSDEEEGGSLYVLTAVLLTPAQFPSILGDDFPEACALLGVKPVARGYGLVLSLIHI